MRARFALIAVTLVGCTNAPVLAVEDYPSVAVSRSCELIFECCDAGMRGGYADAAACEADRMGGLDGFLTTVLPAIEAGRVRWDADAAGRCIDEVSCSSIVAPDSCAGILVPLVENGGTCTSPIECIGGFCDTSTPGMPGACGTPPGEGDACTTMCASGFRCDFSGTMTCVALLPDNAPCTSPIECASFMCDATCTPRPAIAVCPAPP